MSIGSGRTLSRYSPLGRPYTRTKVRFRLIFGYLMICSGLITGIYGFIKNM